MHMVVAKILRQPTNKLPALRSSFKTFTARHSSREENPKISTNYQAPPAPKARTQSRSQSPLRVWPFIFIFVAGTASFVYTVKSRAGTHLPPKHDLTKPPKKEW